MSRTPVTDPNHVPFTYVTEAASYTVRDGSLVELTFTAEHLTDPDAGEPPARVIEARLAMPVVTAANLADVLGRIAGVTGDGAESEAGDEAGDEHRAGPAALSHAVIVAGLDFVVRELLDHSVAAETRDQVLGWLRERLQRELERADLDGVPMADEGPAVDHAFGVLDAMFARWRSGAERSR